MLTKSGEKKFYSSDGSIKPEIINKYYRNSDGTPNWSARVRHEWLSKEIADAADYADRMSRTKNGGKARGDALYYIERKIREDAAILGIPLSDYAKSMKNSLKRNEQILREIESEPNDPELDSYRKAVRQGNQLKKILNRYADGVQVDEETKKRIYEFIERSTHN